MYSNTHPTSLHLMPCILISIAKRLPATHILLYGCACLHITLKIQVGTMVVILSHILSVNNFVNFRNIGKCFWVPNDDVSFHSSFKL